MRNHQISAVDDRTVGIDELDGRDRSRLAERKTCHIDFGRILVEDTYAFSGKVDTRRLVKSECMNILIIPWYSDLLSHTNEDRVTRIHESFTKCLRTVIAVIRLLHPAGDRMPVRDLDRLVGKRRILVKEILFECDSGRNSLESGTGLVSIRDTSVSPYILHQILNLIFVGICIPDNRIHTVRDPVRIIKIVIG